MERNTKIISNNNVIAHHINYKGNMLEEFFMVEEKNIIISNETLMEGNHSTKHQKNCNNNKKSRWVINKKQTKKITIQ